MNTATKSLTLSKQRERQRLSRITFAKRRGRTRVICLCGWHSPWMDAGAMLVAKQHVKERH